MTWRLYLLPIVTVTDGTATWKCPKYLPHRFNPPLIGLEGVVWAWETYLLEDVGFLAADVTTAQHTLLNAQTDVVALPEDLDANVGANRTRIQNLLEAANVPAEWIAAGDTLRAAVRRMLRMWQIQNRIVGQLGEKLFEGRTVDVRLDQLPARVRSGLNAAIDSMGLDRQALMDATTMREVLRVIGDQLRDDEKPLGGVTI